MDLLSMVSNAGGAFASPLLFGVLAGCAVLFTWLAVAPPIFQGKSGERLDSYLQGGDLVEEQEIRRPFTARVLFPALRRVLGLLGRFMPLRAVATTRQRLIQAGGPGGLSALDFMGLRLLCAIGAGVGVLLFSQQMPVQNVLLIAPVGAAVAYLLPSLWLGARVRARKNEISRALPDALDMLTISVEAGLGFESAMQRVCERWDNALTQEMRRTLTEIRLGTPRDSALEHLAQRTDVPELRTFIAVLVQSSRLGVSIADVLHAQAAEIREKRMQKAERLAHEATIKMLFPLAFFIFPSIFIVILGPSLPMLIETLSEIAGGG
ncbi:MAG: type II secretion system F family protein [Chloroflexota bacterium]|nr:type II secretion system F family protein [Chloroflexota bacterium]